eukprot:GHVU01011602.1.p2 GENE.GHVU01011602.1~~GHVU01011602.1.p2  ORF type:complete len:126 (+),score=12.69 GHVU01011602.1:1578-1955(+)
MLAGRLAQLPPGPPRRGCRRNGALSWLYLYFAFYFRLKVIDRMTQWCFFLVDADCFRVLAGEATSEGCIFPPALCKTTYITDTMLRYLHLAPSKQTWAKRCTQPPDPPELRNSVARATQTIIDDH